MATELILKINQDEKYEFFYHYDTLGDLQKKIWNAAVWWCKTFPNAHPRQQKIAEYVGCSRKHVNSTFKKFIQLGWLILISRGAKRAKILFVGDSLLQIDLVNREYYKRVEVTHEVTHNITTKKKHTSRGAGEIPIPHYLERLKISRESKLKLSLLPEKIYQETLHTCKKLSASGWQPENGEKYFVGTAIRLAENQGIRPDWRRYYGNL